MTDQFAWWKSALGGTRGPIHADEPQSGFYETRYKNRQTGEERRGVVAYWRDAENVLFCRAGKAEFLHEMKAIERWPFAAKRPITKGAYDEFINTGKFPGQNEAAHADRKAVEVANNPRNSNDAPDVVSFEGVKDRIEDLAREAERIVKAGAATTQEQCDSAADLADRLRKLEVTADVIKTQEKAPHDEAGKAVLRKWLPLIGMASDWKTRLKFVVVTPYLKAAKAKAEAAAPNEPARATAGGVTATRVTGLREIKRAIIDDYPATLGYFAENEKVKALILQLADAAVRQGTTPPGCRVDTTIKAA